MAFLYKKFSGIDQRGPKTWGVVAMGAIHQTPPECSGLGEIGALFPDKLIRDIVDEAELRGLSVSLVPGKRIMFYQHKVAINGHICYLLSSAEMYQREGRECVYARAFLHASRIDKTNFTLIHVKTPGFDEMYLIIPSQDLLNLRSGGSEGSWTDVVDRKALYIPLLGYKDTGMRLQLNLIDYLDRWDSLFVPKI